MVSREFTLTGGSQTHSTKRIRLITREILLTCNKMRYCRKKQCKMRVSSDSVKNSIEPLKDEWPKKLSESFTIDSCKQRCRNGLAFVSKKIAKSNNFKGLLLKWGKDY